MHKKIHLPIHWFILHTVNYMHTSYADVSYVHDKLNIILDVADSV